MGANKNGVSPKDLGEDKKNENVNQDVNTEKELEEAKKAKEEADKATKEANEAKEAAEKAKAEAEEAKKEAEKVIEEAKKAKEDASKIDEKEEDKPAKPRKKVDMFQPTFNNASYSIKWRLFKKNVLVEVTKTNKEAVEEMVKKDLWKIVKK